MKDSIINRVADQMVANGEIAAPGVREVEITEAQAELLGRFQADMKTIQERMGLVLAGVLTGHGIKGAELISINERIITVRVVD